MNLMYFVKILPLFFSNRHNIATDFVLDTLQLLFPEDVDVECKIHLLELLQEFSTLLFSSSDIAEQTIGSLRNIFIQLKDSDSLIVLKGQILVTIVTILLSYEMILSDVRLKLLFIEVINLLLSIMSKVNICETHYLRVVASHCLKEVELNFPGILMLKLEPLLDLCRKENLPCYQLYMGVFSLALKNAILLLVSNEDRIADNKISELLNGHIEHLQFYLHEDIADITVKPNRSVSDIAVLPKHVNVSELRKVVSLLIDSSALMTKTQLFHIILNLISVIEVTPAVSPVIFKPLIIRYLPTMDLALFHIIFLLKMKFASELFSDNDNYLLLQRLLLCSDHPGLSLYQRLIYLKWIQCNEFKGEIHDFGVKFDKDEVFFSPFHPTAFDLLDIYQNKLQLLSSSWHSNENAEKICNITMSYLNIFKESLHCTMSNTVAVPLFKVLYFYYGNHQKNNFLVHNIIIFLQELLFLQPKIAYHINDFIECIRESHSSSKLPSDVLMNITNYVTSLPVSDILNDFADFLLLLEKAAEETCISPEPILTFLKHLVNCPDIYKSKNWLHGNNILAICKNLLLCHNLTIIFKDIGDILFMIFTHFDDIDVRDKARSYYSMLTCLSSDKLKLILSRTHLKENRVSQNLEQIVTDDNFMCSLSIQQLEHAVFKLTRVDLSKKQIAIQSLNSEKPMEKIEVILEEYQHYLKSSEFEACALLPFILSFVKSEDCTIDDAYSIVLQLQTSNKYETPKEIGIPRISKHGKEDAGPYVKELNLKFFPLEPVPAIFNTSITFSTLNGQIYSTSLEPLEVKFSDLFCSLPVPPQWSQQDVFWREQIYSSLWDSFKESARSSLPENKLYQESLCVFKLTKYQLSEIILNELSPYVIQQCQEIYNVGIFIPPSSHLLLKFIPKDLRVIVSILTDNWKIFPLVNDYLLSLEKNGCTKNYKPDV